MASEGVGALLREALIMLTQAAQGVIEGQYAPETVLAAIEQAAALPGLPDEALPYLHGLARVVEAPDAATLSALVAPAEQLLPSLAAMQRVELEQALAFLFEMGLQVEQALTFQARAIAQLRQEGEAAEALELLSVLLYNQAGFLASAGQFDIAVAALEEVVALDEQLGLSDQEADRAALQRMQRRRDGLPPLDEAELAGLVGSIQEEFDLDPQMEAELRHLASQLAELSEEELAGLQRALEEEHMVEEGDALVDAAIRAHRDGSTASFLTGLAEAARHFAIGDDLDSPFFQYTDLARAVSARLRGEPPLPVPSLFAPAYARLEAAL